MQKATAGSQGQPTSYKPYRNQAINSQKAAIFMKQVMENKA